MQVMPQTFTAMTQRYGLGRDPYDPRANILAGAAFLREMYDRYGPEHFLEAYNAGPGRVDDPLAERPSAPFRDAALHAATRAATSARCEFQRTGSCASGAGPDQRGGDAARRPSALSVAFANAAPTPKLRHSSSRQTAIFPRALDSRTCRRARPCSSISRDVTSARVKQVTAAAGTDDVQSCDRG